MIYLDNLEHLPIRLFGNGFARRLLKGIYRYDVGVRTVAHPGDTSLCECVYMCALANHDVDWQR
jgi:hypothetical protein